MIPDLDIYRTANVLVKRHGEGEAAPNDVWLGRIGRISPLLAPMQFFSSVHPWGYALSETLPFLP